MFSFPAWVAQAWRLQQSTFKEEAHCHPCHGEDQSGAQGLSSAHGQAAVVLTCTIHASWHRAQRGCRTAWCRLGVPRQRSRPQGGTQSGRRLTRAPRPQLVPRSAGRKQRAEFSKLSALEMCSHRPARCAGCPPHGGSLGSTAWSHGAECAGATCASPSVGRWSRSGDFVKMVLIIFSIKHLSVQHVVSLAISGRISVEWGGGDRQQQDASLLSCTFPANERDSRQTAKLSSSPPTAPHHPPSAAPWGTSLLPIPAPRMGAAREGHEALRVNVTLLLVPFRL